MVSTENTFPRPLSSLRCVVRVVHVSGSPSWLGPHTPVVPPDLPLSPHSLPYTPVRKTDIGLSTPQVTFPRSFLCRPREICSDCTPEDTVQTETAETQVSCDIDGDTAPRDPCPQTHTPCPFSRGHWDLLLSVLTVPGSLCPEVGTCRRPDVLTPV